MKELIPVEKIIDKIVILRNEKVMLDADLAELYNVGTKRLNEQVKRNKDRFPSDFMFQLTKEEFENLKSQFATSSWGGRRTLPYVFTEQGVAMLASVLHSQRAIEVNIAIVRAFVKLRRMVESHKQLAKKLQEMENKYNKQFKVVFQVLQKFMEPKLKKSKGKIGFRK